jgi:hypothetical protein
MSNSAMTEVEKILAEAARLPLKDAAYALWRQSPRLDTLEGQPMTAEEHAATLPPQGRWRRSWQR